jgi:condensin complex subunit 1
VKDEIFDALKGIIRSHCCFFCADISSFNDLSRTSMTKILDVVTSGLNSQGDALAAELETQDAEGLESFRKPLEMYSFFLLWIITSAESFTPAKSISGAKESGRGRQSKAKQSVTKDQSSHWDCAPQLHTAFDVMCKILKLKLAKVWTLTSEKDSFVGFPFPAILRLFLSLYTRPAYLVAENESRFKNNALKLRIFKLLCLAVKHQQHGLGFNRHPKINLLAAQTAIVQNLQYYEHLSESMAEFLQILTEQYDSPQLADEILRYIY